MKQDNEPCVVYNNTVTYTNPLEVKWDEIKNLECIMITGQRVFVTDLNKEFEWDGKEWMPVEYKDNYEAPEVKDNIVINSNRGFRLGSDK